MFWSLRNKRTSMYMTVINEATLNYGELQGIMVSYAHFSVFFQCYCVSTSFCVKSFYLSTFSHIFVIIFLN